MRNFGILTLISSNWSKFWENQEKYVFNSKYPTPCTGHLRSARRLQRRGGGWRRRRRRRVDVGRFDESECLRETLGRLEERRRRRLCLWAFEDFLVRWHTDYYLGFGFVSNLLVQASGFISVVVFVRHDDRESPSRGFFSFSRSQLPMKNISFWAFIVQTTKPKPSR